MMFPWSSFIKNQTSSHLTIVLLVFVASMSRVLQYSPLFCWQCDAPFIFIRSELVASACGGEAVCEGVGVIATGEGVTEGPHRARVVGNLTSRASSSSKYTKVTFTVVSSCARENSALVLPIIWTNCASPGGSTINCGFVESFLLKMTSKGNNSSVPDALKCAVTKHRARLPPEPSMTSCFFAINTADKLIVLRSPSEVNRFWGDVTVTLNFPLPVGVTVKTSFGSTVIANRLGPISLRRSSKSKHQNR